MRSYAAENKPAAGLQKVQDYAAQAPQSVAVQRFLAESWVANGKPDLARKVLLAAKAVQPKALELYLDLAYIDLADGKPDVARQYLTDLLSAGTRDNRVRLKLGCRRDCSRRLWCSHRPVSERSSSQPRDGLALNNLAYLLSDFKAQPDEALKYAQEATKELSPNSATADDTLGWTYYRKGVYTLAVRYLESSVTREATAKHRYHLAMAYLKLGERAKGKQVLDAALRTDSSLPEAIAARQVWTEVTATK